MLDCTRFLLMQGLSSRGHDESKESLNKGNLIGLLNWYATRRKKINEVLFSNAPGNDQMTSPSIHNDLVNCCAVETTRSMIYEIGDSLFSILVDESCDNSIKEQMVVVLRFVDKSGQVKEHLLGICHIADTCAQSLKDAINATFSTHGLSISSLRGQGYDGTSNMSGEFNGLKALILRENPCAMYIHFFAHQLQLAVVSMAHRNVMLSDLFNMLAIIVNLRLNIEELFGGTSRFQEMSLARPDDLSQALQKKDQNIQNAMRLLKLCKCTLQNMRDNGWDTLLSKVIQFCVDRHISVPNMDDIVVSKGRPRRASQQVTYYHCFYVDLFCYVIDSILQELNDRFPETTTELFTCISCLSPRDSFAAFDVCKLVRLAQLYPIDFNSEELLLIRPQLDKFLMLVRMDEAFFNLKSISCVAQKLVETGSSCYFPWVYRLITLVLILPVATASVERVFSAMNLIKNDLRNKMGEELLNDNLVVYMERDLFMKLENETILQRFQNIRPRRIQLSKLTISE
ncbi:uncharacterized protein LOC111390766 [Olea europaea var. sylvestris]|uniref:uncharacterized protein LOC111390766 n=1 Tax=Olea europaea var. sylvestris TaxID=158386 RepID=UPI000C1D721D|nr:uncharacterized protein LOC111390766 [Olea europaea var. sylvestris]